ncbi:MAG: gamma-glutamyl-gamma-aminobutyrate hydrolase family protein [Nitrospirae bacterium]|nr:gamma-glutamyl-gamma-aminobutyrate hydrolase family protein [Nitrospirota bacterium]
MPPIIAITAKTEELRNMPQTTISAAYAKAVEDAGGIPVIIPILDKGTNITHIARLADGLLLSGGDDIHPDYYGERPLLGLSLSPDERTDFEIALFKEALRLQKPVLGVCLGSQLINVALGGSLYQDIPMQITNPINHRAPHSVSIIEGSLLNRIFSGETREIQVVSTHHQAVKSAGKGLVVSAHSSDGMIEAIEMSDYPFLIGIQWHPEQELDNEYTRMLFNAFVDAAETRSGSTPGGLQIDGSKLML